MGLFIHELDIDISSHGSNWFCNADDDQQNQTDNNTIMEIWPYDDFFFPMPYQSKQLCISNEFQDLENFDFDFTLPPLDEHFEDKDQKPLNAVLSEERENGFLSCVKKELEEEEENEKMALPLTRGGNNSNSRGGKKKLEFDEIKKYFGVPISVAAKEMKVGMTKLKKRCRELNIMRWPHRKLKSLELLIHNVEEMGLVNEVAMLEKQKKMLEKLPGMELNEETKKLRQAYFKADFKRRRFLGRST